MRTHCRPSTLLAALALALSAGSAQAVNLNFESLGIEGTLNNTVTVGAQWRMETRSEDLVGKANLNQGVCRGVYSPARACSRIRSTPASSWSARPAPPACAPTTATSITTATT